MKKYTYKIAKHYLPDGSGTTVYANKELEEQGHEWELYDWEVRKRYVVLLFRKEVTV